MEKCVGCELPIEEYGSRKDHLCKQCYVRRTNCKNRGIKYIPIKDLSEIEREKIISRRNRYSKDKEPKKFKDEELDKIKEEKERINDIKLLVRKDIENTFKRCGLELDLSQYSIHSTMKMLFTLVSNYDKIKDKLDFTKKILNGMSTDYSHAKEYHSTQYIMNFDNYTTEERLEAKKAKELAEEKHNRLMIERRELMKVITEYEIMCETLTYIVNNSGLMNALNRDYARLERFEEMYANKQYNTEYSDLIAREDFVVGYKDKSFTKCKWKVTVPTYSYDRGQRKVGSFNRNDIEAYDEVEAKDKFKKFMDSQKYSFTWFESEATVENLGPIVETASTPR